jgi:hypothetical protein
MYDKHQEWHAFTETFRHPIPGEFARALEARALETEMDKIKQPPNPGKG